jgi:hypothetical protein
MGFIPIDFQYKLEIVELAGDVSWDKLRNAPSASASATLEISTRYFMQVDYACDAVRPQIH